MAFSIRKFNNAEIPVNAKELLGKLVFISFIENFKMVDGSPVDYPTHAEVFSDKMQEIIPIKLLVMPQFGFMKIHIQFHVEITFLRSKVMLLLCVLKMLSV